MTKKNHSILFSCLGIGILTGICCWFFSMALDYVTLLRRSLSFWPFLLLPFVGMTITWFYQKFGQVENRGNNLVLDEVHHPTKKIRKRLVPMIFGSSILSHAFGASVGREGVGVQMGAGIADQFSHQHTDRALLLMMGMSAGFAGIFNAPMAGTLFGVEILMVGNWNLRAIIPCLMAAFTSYGTCTLLGIHHFQYPKITFESMSIGVFLSCLILGLAFGILARFFSFILHGSKSFFKKLVPSPIGQTFVGGISLCSVFFLMNSDRYLGMSEELVKSAFNESLLKGDFLGKMLTTAISVGSGFKGGEVMPLFIVGGAFGNAIASYVTMSKILVVALGYVSVFAGASNTPISSIILSIEFFGWGIAPYSILTILVSFLVSGEIGIYSSQKKEHKKKFSFMKSKK